MKPNFLFIYFVSCAYSAMKRVTEQLVKMFKRAT